MANALDIELSNITSYVLSNDSKRIINITSENSSCVSDDTIKVLALLDRLFINYSIDENYNFQLYPEYSFRGSIENG